MKIRKYSKKDKTQVKNLISGILIEIFGECPEKELNDIEKANKIFDLFLIVEERGNIIGSAGITKEGIIKRMYISKDFRNKGLAKKLYSKLEIFAKEKHLKKIKLSTTSQMKTAINFYMKNGFIKTKEDKEKNQIFFEKLL